MEEKGKRRGSCGKSQNRVKVVKRVAEMGDLAPQARVTSKPRLLPRAMSGSMVLPQPGAVSPSLAHMAIQRMQGCPVYGLTLMAM